DSDRAARDQVVGDGVVRREHVTIDDYNAPSRAQPRGAGGVGADQVPLDGIVVALQLDREVGGDNNVVFDCVAPFAGAAREHGLRGVAAVERGSARGIDAEVIPL